MASHTIPWLGSMFFLVHAILVSHQNLPLLFPFYFVAQEANVAPRVSTIRQVIQTDGLAFGSSPITKAKGARIVML